MSAERSWRSQGDAVIPVVFALLPVGFIAFGDPRADERRTTWSDRRVTSLMHVSVVERDASGSETDDPAGYRLASRVRPVVDPQLGEYVQHVRLYRGFVYEEAIPDLPVGETLRDEFKDLDLAGAQRHGMWITNSADEARCNARRKSGFSRGCEPYRLEEFLQQVAGCLRQVSFKRFSSCRQ
jgi:hypothetical protein